MKTVFEVLEDHGIQARRGSIHCPVHEDSHPSASIIRGDEPDGAVYCFACQWSGDAAGLEAALSDRTPADVLRAWNQNPAARTTYRKVPRWRKVKDLQVAWAVRSQPYIDEVRRALQARGSAFVDFSLGDLDDLWMEMRDRFLDEERPIRTLEQDVTEAVDVVKRWRDRWV